MSRKFLLKISKKCCSGCWMDPLLISLLDGSTVAQLPVECFLQVFFGPGKKLHKTWWLARKTEFQDMMFIGKHKQTKELVLKCSDNCKIYNCTIGLTTEQRISKKQHFNVNHAKKETPLKWRCFLNKKVNGNSSHETKCRLKSGLCFVKFCFLSIANFA